VYTVGILLYLWIRFCKDVISLELSFQYRLHIQVQFNHFQQNEQSPLILTELTEHTKINMWH
jgi:hypothetical protein